MNHWRLFLLFCLSMLSAEAQIIVTEVNYNSDSTTNSGNWFEIYNNSAANVNLNGWQATDLSGNFFTFPPITLAPDRYLVVSDDTALFHTFYPLVSNVTGPIPFGLSNNSDAITILDDNGSTVFTMIYHDSLPFPKGCDNFGRTMEKRTYGADPNNGFNWFDGCMGGSPGRAYTPCDDPIVFSEINFNSGTLYPAGDWVELKNRTASPIDISDWRIRDDKDTNEYRIPAGTILPAGGYMVICSDTQAFRFLYPSVQNFRGPLGFGFGKGGDVIRLYHPESTDGKLQYSVVYDDTLSWPLEADGGDKTLELLSETGIMDDGNNWFAGCLGGSPGQAYNAACTLTVVNELSARDIGLQVLYSAGRPLIRWHDTGEQHVVTIAVRNLSGQLLQSVKTNDNSLLLQDKFPSGMYLVEWTNGISRAVLKMVSP